MIWFLDVSRFGYIWGKLNLPLILLSPLQQSLDHMTRVTDPSGSNRSGGRHGLAVLGLGQRRPRAEPPQGPGRWETRRGESAGVCMFTVYIYIVYIYIYVCVCVPGSGLYLQINICIPYTHIHVRGAKLGTETMVSMLTTAASD